MKGHQNEFHPLRRMTGFASAFPLRWLFALTPLCRRFTLHPLQLGVRPFLPFGGAFATPSSPRWQLFTPPPPFGGSSSPLRRSPRPAFGWSVGSGVSWLGVGWSGGWARLLGECRGVRNFRFCVFFCNTQTFSERKKQHKKNQEINHNMKNCEMAKSKHTKTKK